MKLSYRTLFNMALLLFFGIIMILSVSYGPTARQLPLLYGSIGFVMMLGQLLFDAFPGLQKRLKWIGQPAVFDHEKHEDSKNGAGRESWTRVFIAVMWLVVFLVLFYYFHYLIVMPLFIFLMTKIAGREGWVSSIAVSAAAGIFVWLLFDQLLQVSF